MLRRSSLLLTILISACIPQTPRPSVTFPEMEWRYEDGVDAEYLVAPGDTLEVIVHTAPELSRTVTVAPDGRISMPYAGQVQASARTINEVRDELLVAYANELRDPVIDVAATSYASQRIFVGGDVGNPGMFELPGQIDPLQAIIMAGGFTTTSKPSQVMLLRRLPGGEVKTAVFNINQGIYDPALAEWTPLRRFDVIYVPKTLIAQENLLMQQWFRAALPVEFSLFYDLAPQNR
mgnify:CR=1 FL=1